MHKGYDYTGCSLANRERPFYFPEQKQTPPPSGEGVVFIYEASQSVQHIQFVIGDIAVFP